MRKRGALVGAHAGVGAPPAQAGGAERLTNDRDDKRLLWRSGRGEWLTLLLAHGVRMASVVFGVQVDASRLNRRMPQVLLDKADIGAGVGLVRSRGMAQPGVASENGK